MASNTAVSSLHSASPRSATSLRLVSTAAVLIAGNDAVHPVAPRSSRAPREGEQDGVNYFFHSRESFDRLVSEGGLLEWAEFAGNCYGTPKRPVLDKLEAGTPVLLEIELEGARQVRCSFPDALQIFLAPPSFGELEQRIRGRGTDAEAAIVKRLDRARAELEAQQEFDAVVINDDLETALGDVERLMGLADA